MRKTIFAFLTILFICLQSAAQEPSVSEWNGYTRYDYSVGDRDAIMVVPDNPAPGNPWIWRPAFFDAFPSVDKALLEEGWHVGYYDVTHCNGCPQSLEWAKEFYDDALQRFALNPKCTIEGFSRGGFFCFAWAGKYPETLASIYVDAPVCNLSEWPGRSQPELWNEMLELWNARDEEVTSGFYGNAIHNVEAIVKAGIPIIAVVGGKDTDVPYEKHFKPVLEAIQSLGGVVELIMKPECGHHPHSLEDPEPVIDFLKRYAPGYSGYQDIHLRGDLDNSLYAMAVRKKACVAFLGGSITEMTGWRDMMKEDLQQRFPDTEFSFIEAGIGSLGSTPHAFRFEHDVLAHGTPDLMFLEAAVNDDTNSFSAQAQIRAMEGIVRHALKANPRMDIAILDFIYDPFLPLMDRGVMPEVVFNHESVAEHYDISTINLISEIHSRMAAGEFDWEKFGGTHPAWFGHKFYAAAINALLDANTKPLSEYKPEDHRLPAPLDDANYENGRFVPLNAAYAVKGFEFVEDWAPSFEVGTRNGFVNVPMLAARNGGSFKLDFNGTAVGLFMVAGPDAAVLKYRIDRGRWKTMDTYTEWSPDLYIPWVYTLADGLQEGDHTLELKILKGEHMGCVIRNFVVN